MGKLGLRLAPSLEIRPLLHLSNAGSARTHVVKKFSRNQSHDALLQRTIIAAARKRVMF
jgi:hypothetical protein